MGILFREYELLSSCGLFDAEYYVRTYPDIADLNTDPILHYLEVGGAKVLNPSAKFDSAYYLEQCRLKGEMPENPLVHYLTVGAALGLRPRRGEPKDALAPSGEPSAPPPIVRARAGHALAPLQLEIDEASVDAAGVLTVSGWAVCWLDIVSIDVLIDEEVIGRADYGRPREDVAMARKEYPRALQSGFAFNADLTRFAAGTRTVKVVAVAQSGISRCATIEVSVPEPTTPLDSEGTFHFHCDHIALSTSGRVAVEGWLLCRTTVDSISVVLNGTDIGCAIIGLERPDVARAYPNISYARNSGFSFRQSRLLPVAAGEHLLILKVRDALGGTREVPLPAMTTEAADEEANFSPDAASLDTHALENRGEICLAIDSPRITHEVADAPVISSLSIHGWAFAPAGIAEVSITIDGGMVARAQHGIRRDDVATAFPDRPEALQSGFATLIPYWQLSKGTHTVGIQVRDRSDHTATVRFGIDVEDIPEGEGPWSLRRKINQAEVNLALKVLAGHHWRPWFRVLVAAGDAPAAQLRKTLLGLSGQAYAHWDVWLIARDKKSFGQNWCSAVLEGLDEDLAERMRFCATADSMSSSRLRALPRGHWDGILVVPLSSGDVLGCDALLELALASGESQDAELFYGDERCHSTVTSTVQAYFKPGWSPDLLLSTNYIGRPWCVRAALLDRAELTIKEWLANGDYDLVLRATEAANGVRHVPKVLCERGSARLDTAPRERRALTRALARRGVEGDIAPGCREGFYRVKPKRAEHGRVSIIIPTCASRGLIKTCLQTLKAKTVYRDYEIICIENIPPDGRGWKRWLRKNADRVIETDEPFNWSRYNNLCAQQASGKFLLFLNDDVEIEDPDWLDTLLHNAARPEVGLVGPQLLYPDRTVQHAGLALTNVPGRARHLFRHGREDDPGYFGLALAQRNVIAVTGACMLMRRDVFDALGGFDEAYDVINNDLDFCLRAWKRGLLVVYTPHAQLVHHEMISRAKLGDAFDSASFNSKWRDIFLDGDPYLNRNISRDCDDLVPEREPVTAMCAGRPLFDRGCIGRILVVKLDHIGDCIMSMPAIRKLKQHFPRASISVLSASVTRPVWEMESAVDEIIEFNFFHARSQLGKVGISERQLAALREQLSNERFDIAVDLRKSPDTRHVLQYAGAKFLAGFDYQNRFPWLDVALQWEGDPSRIVKRRSASDDLVNLVDALGASCDPHGKVLDRRAKRLAARSTEDARGLFDRPLVCIHAGAGNEMKSWPSASFCELIDLLMERDGVQVAMVGGSAEVDLCSEIIGRVRDPARCRNFAGKLSLSELPDLLQKARLFVGNDSGPKHIAAALGIPTVGIHSGNIDPREWGPVGPRAVAIWRQTACSPCYIETASECPRNLACIKGVGAGEVYRLCRKMLRSGPAGIAASNGPPRPGRTPRVPSKARARNGIRNPG